MSMWTHIVAAIDVDTCAFYVTDAKSATEKFLKYAPKITGSEEDAAVFVNILPGHNSYTNRDCNSCEYGNAIIRHPQLCGCPNGYKCPDGEYQSRVVITVIGDLRDRMLEETQKEWDDFKAYVDGGINKKGYIIRNCSCNIIGE